MNVVQPVTLHCKVKVRKYVLVSDPTRWKRKGERIVVQSPMLDIPKSVSHVPVKRYQGEEQNTVCFLPKHDIEKDSSNVYEKSKVTKAHSWIDAHGVALFDSSPLNIFSYKRGDPFWICIGACKDGYTTTAPVINLKTAEKGDIAIDQVCWYPKIKGPDHEIWTPGGPTGMLKLEGTKKYRYYSWVICQQDDRIGTTVKEIEIPAKDSRWENIWHLTPVESRSLFEKRLQLMESSISSVQMNSSLAHSPAQISLNSRLPTPPASPEHDHLRKLQVARGQKRRRSSTSALTAPAIGLWKRIIANLPQTKKLYVLKNSCIHPQQLPEIRSLKRKHSCAEMEAIPDEDDVFSQFRDEIFSPYLVRESSPSRSQPKDSKSNRSILPLFSPELGELGELGGPDIEGAIALFNIFQDGRSRPAFSITPDVISRAPNSIYEAWMRDKPRHNPCFDNLCDQRNQNCPYTNMFPYPHFHSPPEKCLLEAPLCETSCRCPPLSSLGMNDTQEHKHEHCISRLAPLPSGAGDCLLASHPTRNHKCCYWSPSSLASLPILHKRNYHTSKEVESRRKRMRIPRLHDRTGLVDRRLELGLCLRDCDGVGDDVLGEQGRKLCADIDGGLFGGVVGNVRLELETRTDGTDGDKLCEELLWG